MPRIAQRRWNMGRRRRFRANRSADGATAVVMRSGLGDAHDRFGPDLRFGAMARRAPLDDAWRSLPPRTRRAIRRPPSCTGLSGTISRPSAPTRPRCATARASRVLWSRSFATSCGAAAWPVALLGSGAQPADWIDWSRSPARVGAFVPGAVVAAWPNAPRIWSIMSSPTCRSASGCSVCRIGCGTCWRGITISVGRSAAWPCGRCSDSSDAGKRHAAITGFEHSPSRRCRCCRARARPTRIVRRSARPLRPGGRRSL